MQWKANPWLSNCGSAEWIKVFPPTHQGEVACLAPFPSRSSAPCLGGGVPADGYREGSHVQGLDSQQPSCCAAICGPSPNLAQKITGWQLSIIQARSTPHGIPHLELPSLGAGAEASVHSHFHYYPQSYLESIIFQMQRWKENKNA